MRTYTKEKRCGDECTWTIAYLWPERFTHRFRACIDVETRCQRVITPSSEEKEAKGKNDAKVLKSTCLSYRCSSGDVLPFLPGE
jgi:hypothetical protein